MSFPNISVDNVIKILLALSQYPILSRRIRHYMRKTLFSRGIITKAAFDAEARQKAIESQVREGLHNPYIEERSDIWADRLLRISDSLTDFYFAYNLPYAEFENLVRQMLAERGSSETEFIWFNPELAPQDMLFEQAEMIESMPKGEREKYEARLQELIAVLIRTMISDQLKYITIARQWFKVEDLKDIRARKIGGGKIGGKAAGMLLAMRVIKETAPPEIRDRFTLPNSYYLGSDVFYNFLTFNDLVHWNDQKYKTEDQMRIDYPQLLEEFSKGKFPLEITESLQRILSEIGQTPLIVRSSTLLEDNFGTSFAGKYESLFLPNQGSFEENLDALERAIAQIYASSKNPGTLMYLHHKGLVDYDERVAILIQQVVGEYFGNYFLPHASGVSFSRNLYRWSPQIRQEEGFLRLVWGLGTRAVDITSDDYARLVALSHPLLYPNSTDMDIHRYSQHYVDVIDIEKNSFITLPIHSILSKDYEETRYIAQLYRDGYLSGILSNNFDSTETVVTFSNLLRRTRFVDSMKTVLTLLESNYKCPVEMEFVVNINDPDSQSSEIQITIVQCRPQSYIAYQDTEAKLPLDLDKNDILFSTHRMVPNGVIRSIRYILYVSPDGYHKLPSQESRNNLQRAISKLNQLLEKETFIAIGPGRWGTSTPDLGVHVDYADIYNTKALIEISGYGKDIAPEPSFGTHFFQDLMEASIYPLAIYVNDHDSVFRQDIFEKAPNRLKKFLDIHDRDVFACLYLIDAQDLRQGYLVDLVMDNDKGKAVAYLVSAVEELNKFQSS